jgi:hypothetical protein
MALRVGGRARGAARMHEGVVRAAHFCERDDLRANEDVVRSVRHLVRS